MTFLEKQTDPTAPAHWLGNMQADYFYSSGTAGDRFFKNLMKKGSFLVSRCPECEMVYVPPRLYCEDCFCEIPNAEWKEVPARGWVRLYTKVMIDAHGKKLKEPRTIALIDIEGTDGSMLGIVKLKDPEQELWGLKVKAVLKPKKEREGTQKDILYYQEI